MLSLREFAEAALHLLAPERCPGCDLDRPAKADLCEACEPLVERTWVRRPPSMNAAAFVYGGPLADALLRLKYGGRAELARPLGHLLAHECSAYAGQIDLILPVPLHRSRMRSRGFNQSALLASQVARTLAVPLDTRSLQRTRSTAEQAGLPRDERSANVRAAFASRAAPRPGLRALLIDDIETTGATLAEASSALRLAGFEEVRTLAFARAGFDP